MKKNLMKNNAPFLPSALETYLYGTVNAIIFENLRSSKTIDVERLVEDCIYYSCDWLLSHILGNSFLDPFTTMDEIVDSFRKECPEAIIAKSGHDTYTIRLSETDWTLYPICCVNDELPIRLSYQNHTLRPFIPTTKCAWMVKSINSFVPVFRRTIRELIVSGNRQMLISLIEKTSAQARQNSK